MTKKKTCAATDWTKQGPRTCSKKTDDKCFVFKSLNPLTTEYFCRWHYAKIKWNCEKGCRDYNQHSDPAGICYQLRMKKWKKNQWTYTNNLINPKNMTTQQLKKAITIDIQELKEILPIDEGLLPNEDDTETWDSDACGDLLTKIEQVKTVIESENGLNDKLEEWNYRQEDKGNTTDF